MVHLFRTLLVSDGSACAIGELSVGFSLSFWLMGARRALLREAYFPK
jgi:hypothetical protein